MINEISAYSRALAGVRFIVAAAAARAKPVKELAEHATRAFPTPLEVRTFPNATFIHEIGDDSPLACLTGDDHEEKGRALVSAVAFATGINSHAFNVDLLSSR
ncbi:hypothetical protein [Ensifer sp. LCM 4579]|uniref:hypothetical protein n=1 Tax=Ensifer sp. LCM 4579 TaxID=1848292 RepID=UPI0008DAC32E|nr:hypothetical protein [Ensifer sp. LCM 4579]OHV73362.1 hypothetical protein LCM4579_10600 [Ensifer sp. LCM 4579]